VGPELPDTRSGSRLPGPELTNKRALGLGLGKRPTSPGFGAHLLPTAGVAGHDYYLVPGSATLRAVTDIVLSGALVS
jgi:hypothetical protein